MPKAILITLTIVLIIFVSIFSYELGKKQIPEAALVIKLPLLESKVIQSWQANAQGKVIEIKDRVLTLAAEGESLEIPIKEKVAIVSLFHPKGEIEPELKEIGFEDITIGDEVSINVEIKQDGQREGTSIVVFQAPIPEKEERLTPEEEEARLKEVEKTLNKWLPTVLKPEWLPERFEVKEEDSNTFSGSWVISQKEFRSTFAYNTEKLGTNFLSITLDYFGEIELNKEVALNTCKRYFVIPDVEFFCEYFEERKEKKYDQCVGSWEENNVKKQLFIFWAPTNKGNKVVLFYYLRPPESEKYYE